MRLNDKFLAIIKKYLRREESISERKELYSLYETLKATSKPLSRDNIVRLHEIGKKRLFKEVGGELVNNTLFSPIWYRAVAAVLFFVATFFGINYYYQRDNLIAVSAIDIKKIAPESGKATMTLSTGEVITLDTLDDLETARLGGSTISNNGSGALSYKAGNDNTMAEHTIGTLQTARAAQYNIELSDGTRVWLNAKSKLSFPERFGKGDRVVQLSGEGYFEVKKTMQKSKFIVQSNGQEIEVLGTKFNVNSYVSSNIKTTLAEGSVRITPGNKSIGPIILKPNQQSVLNVGKIQQFAVDASRVIAWKDGYFTFDGNNTQEILQEIGDWYGISVTYKNTAKMIRYTGKIPKNINLDRLVMLLGYQDIDVKAYKDKNNQLKLIVN